jgi:hypothetical protein
MSRVSVFLVLFGLVGFVACYYDQSTPELPSVETPNLVSKTSAYEMAQQPIKFKFGKTDVVEDTTATDADATPETAACGGEDCEASNEVCDPVSDKCVPCYVDGSKSINCPDGQTCYPEETDPTQNVCL